VISTTFALVPRRGNREELEEGWLVLQLTANSGLAPFPRERKLKVPSPLKGEG